MNDFRETLYTIDTHGKRKWVYPTIVEGFFYKRRRIVAYLLVLLYISMPWITIGGSQAVLLDIASRKFTFFGTTLWATDTRILALTLLILGLSLFFFTSLLGRVWCGWACPETVFLEFIFRPLETWIEGNSAQRKRLKEAPWNIEKIIKRGTKYALYTVICWVLASTAFAYFVGRETLLEMMTHSPLLNLSTFLVTLIWMAGLLFQFSWFREQFCTVVCPYARFQSVLLDQNSLLVGYDKTRGEPRGKIEHAGADSTVKKGDCIDCGLCVRVCPTGIDIRNGTQLECIHCAECVDACNSIMTKVGRPQGLIRYDTEAVFEGGKRRILRPRVIVYAVLLCVLTTLFLFTLITRQESEFQIVRGARDLPFSTLDDGRISNHLHLHFSNKSENTEWYTVSVPKDSAVELITPVNPFPVEPGKTAHLPLFFNFSPTLLVGGKLSLVVSVKDQVSYAASQKITLLGPDK